MTSLRSLSTRHGCRVLELKVEYGRLSGCEPMYSLSLFMFRTGVPEFSLVVRVARMQSGAVGVLRTVPQSCY